MNHKRNFALLISIPALLDGILTLTGQDPTYWSDYSNFNEGNPIGALAISFHPLVFLLVAITWCAIVAAITYNLPKKYALMFGAFWFIIHTITVSSWLPYNFHLYLGLSSEMFDSIGMIIGTFSGALISSVILYFAVQQWILIKQNKR